MPQLAGTQIHHYRLQHLLGQGGMSEVYLAYDEHLHCEVAVKLVEKNQPEYFERLQHEIATVRSLKHDHILPILAYGEYASWCYLVMPYLKSGTLRERLDAKGALTQEEAGNLLEQIASALTDAHEHGILHRDVKSSNILLRDDSYVYLADFGLAKEQQGGLDLTQPGYIMGTPEYLAPELQVPFATATPGSDLYALGILLYEMLTGQVPFQESADETAQWQQIHKLPVRPSLLQPTLSSAIDQVVLRALEKEPDQRFQTPQELAQAYQQAIKPASRSQTAVAVVSSQPSPHLTKRVAPWRRFPFWLRIGFAIAAFALLLFSSVALFANNRGTVVRPPHHPIAVDMHTPSATTTTITTVPSQMAASTPTVSSSPAPTLTSVPMQTTCPAQVTIDDQAQVLDVANVCSVAATLGYPIQILTFTNIAGGNAAIDKLVQMMATNNPNQIVLAMNTDAALTQAHVGISGGKAIPLTMDKYHQAVDAFNRSFMPNHDYMGATITAINSLNASLSM